MKKAATVYAYSIAFIGTIFAIGCVYLYVQGLVVGTSPSNLPEFITLAIMFVICRSLPLYISPSSAVDMSFMCLFTCMLLYGPITTCAMIAISTPFTFEMERTASRQHFFTLFNMSPLKTLFNMGNPILSVLIAGYFFELLGGVAGNTALPGVLLPALVFVMTVIILNSSILYILLSFNGQVNFLKALKSDMVQLLPTFFSSAPIGYFMAILIVLPSGIYLAILFMLPLMLARYAFKMYLSNRQSYYKLIRTLTAAMEAKDTCTNGHSQRVEIYAEILARSMNLSSKQQEIVTTAALLHDIGKIGINDSILNKPGPLTTDERKVIQTHPRIGLTILDGAEINPLVKDTILHHHEYYDGRGYPDGTKMDEIPILSYILGTVDAFDVITSDRPYKKGRSFDEALAILQEESGKQFHPQVVASFIKIKDQIQAVMENPI